MSEVGQKAASWTPVNYFRSPPISRPFLSCAELRLTAKGWLPAPPLYLKQLPTSGIANGAICRNLLSR
jgi:hypothetical protein